MTSTHTPGPWRVDPRGVGTPWNIGTDTQDVALAGQLVGDSLRQPTRAANARLIAAAPEMRDALAAIAPLLPDDVQDKVRALLARIDGDSPKTATPSREEQLQGHLDWALANLSAYIRKEPQSGPFMARFKAASALVLPDPVPDDPDPDYGIGGDR